MTNEELKTIFLDLGPAAFTLNHYELAKETQVTDAVVWKNFLKDTEISQWIASEVSLLREIELRKLTSNISDSRSVGQAQLINSLSKVNENTQVKEGPAFIYCYIPLSTEQEHADNILRIENDPFIERG